MIAKEIARRYVVGGRGKGPSTTASVSVRSKKKELPVFGE